MDYLSYLMGGKGITDNALRATGASSVEATPSGDRKVKIPKECLGAFEKLMREKLSNGYWNEYVGADKIHFIFKFADGAIKEYDLTPDNEREIDRLCAKFANEKPETTANVYKYVAQNEFYHDLMQAHWKQMIER